MSGTLNASDVARWYVKKISNLRGDQYETLFNSIDIYRILWINRICFVDYKKSVVLVSINLYTQL